MEVTMSDKWSGSKNFRYLVFCVLHFFVDCLQPAIDEKEREEFMTKFHQYDIRD